MLQCASKSDKISARAGILLSLCLTLCGWGGASSAVAYSVFELKPVNKNFSPELNDNDNVVWFGLDEIDGDNDIFYYDGTVPIKKVVDNAFSEFSPKINNSDVIVWHGDSNGLKVFSYNVGGFSNISGPSTVDPAADKFKVGFSPEINASGNAAWVGTDFDPTDDYDIYFYDGASAVAITANNDVDDTEAKINDSGEIVWQSGNVGSDLDICFYDGVINCNIGADLAGNDRLPQINNAVPAQVVWSHGSGNDTVIRLWSASAGASTISDASTNNKLPQINDSGQVVWQGQAADGSDAEIFLYTPGSGVQRLTNNTFEDLEPQINNIGVVAWRGRPDSDSEIFVWNAGTTIQVTDDNCNNLHVRINNNNTLVWEARDGSNHRIILAIDDGGLDTSIQCAVTSTPAAPSSSRKGDSGGCALNTRAGFDPVLIFLLLLSMLYVWRKHPQSQHK